jgi:hypothetical protein
MGEIHDPTPVQLIIAVSSRYPEALDWARKVGMPLYGPVLLVSDAFEFTETDYYAATMGVDLKKQFLAFERLVDPVVLADVKRQTNQWETEYAALGQYEEPRPLNLDPGYITAAKLVLASTKDHAHRIYLQGGIYAEVTLAFRHRRWQPLDWTYPDYRRDDYQQFFSQCRQFVLNCGSRGDGLK